MVYVFGWIFYCLNLHTSWIKLQSELDTIDSYYNHWTVFVRKYFLLFLLCQQTLVMPCWLYFVCQWRIHLNNIILNHKKNLFEQHTHRSKNFIYIIIVAYSRHPHSCMFEFIFKVCPWLYFGKTIHLCCRFCRMVSLTQ